MWQNVTRGGHKCRIFGELSKPNNSMYPIRGEIKEGGAWFSSSWSTQGRAHNDRETSYDLIPKAKEENMNLIVYSDGIETFVCTAEKELELISVWFDNERDINDYDREVCTSGIIEIFARTRVDVE